MCLSTVIMTLSVSLDNLPKVIRFATDILFQ